MQNTPPGSADLSIQARIDGTSHDDLRRYLEDDRSLVQAWSCRAAPHIFPRDNYHTFTLGLMPWDERFLRHFIMGAGKSLDQAGLSVTELTAMMFQVLTEVLNGRKLSKARLAVEVADLMYAKLPAHLRALWGAPGAFGQFGETLVGYGLYLGSLAGVLCHGSREGTSALLVRPDQWLGAMATSDPVEARKDIVRRYLHCYGPSTSANMAAWSGVHPLQASRMWEYLSEELVEVSCGGRRMWLLTSDERGLEDPCEPEGARLLPPHDPYLQSRDRELLLPDTSLHHQVWKMAGGPGTVLDGGEVVGTWRPQRKGRHLSLSIVPFRHLSSSSIVGIKEETERMANLRELSLAEVKLSEPLHS